METFGLKLDDDELKVTQDDLDLEVSPLEFEVLWTLAKRPGDLVKLHEIRAAVSPLKAKDNSYMKYIVNELREKIRYTQAAIDAIIGVGYRLRKRNVEDV